MSVSEIKREPDRKMIAWLEDMLAKAKAGDLVDIVATYRDESGDGYNLSYFGVSTASRCDEMLARLERAKFALLSDSMEDS